MQPYAALALHVDLTVNTTSNIDSFPWGPFSPWWTFVATCRVWNQTRNLRVNLSRWNESRRCSSGMLSLGLTVSWERPVV